MLLIAQSGFFQAKFSMSLCTMIALLVGLIARPLIKQKNYINNLCKANLYLTDAKTAEMVKLS